MKSQFQTSRANQARSLLLNAITFYQRSLGRVRNVDADQVESFVAGLERYESEFQTYEGMGWPPSLEPLSEEVDHLAGRLRRALAEKAPGSVAAPTFEPSLSRCA